MNQTVRGYCNPNSKATTCELNMGSPIHIFVLIPGTTDPVNSETYWSDYKDKLTYADTLKLVDLADPNIPVDKKKESQKINTFANETYWSSYPDFMPDMRLLIEDLKAVSHSQVYFIEKVRWSGDNNDDERRDGANRVLDLLLKTGPAYQWIEDDKKEELKQQTVHVHMMGHSHGGNVMNEVTQQWKDQAPTTWHLKTLIYLSTPFFSNMHAIKPEALHKDCKIINAFNDYDLTQRTIADFTVKPLGELHRTIETWKEAFKPLSAFDWDQILNYKINMKDGKWDDKKAKENNGDGWEAATWHPAKPSDNGKENDEIEGYWEGKSGPGIWRSLYQLLKPLDGTLIKCLEDFKGELSKTDTSKSKLLNNDILGDLLNIVNSLEKWIGRSSEKIEDRIFTRPETRILTGYGLTFDTQEPKDNVFTILTLLDDLELGSLISILANLLGLNIKSNKETIPQDILGSSLFDTLDKVLINILKAFDDTAPQPTGSALAGSHGLNIIQCDVTNKDPFQKANKPDALTLLEELEELQKDYANSPNKANRQKLLLTLGLNTADLSPIYQKGWFGLIVNLSDNLLTKAESDDRQEDLIDEGLDYLKRAKSQLIKWEEEYQMDIQCTQDWLFQQMVALKNDNPHAMKYHLLNRIRFSKWENIYIRYLNQWQSYLVKTVDKCKQYFRYPLSPGYIPISLFLENWPNQWGKPPSIEKMIDPDNDFKVKTHPELGHNLETVPVTSVKGSIPYMAVVAHSISRTRVYRSNPEIWNHILESVKHEIKK